MNLKLFCFSILTSIFLVGCGSGGESETTSINENSGSSEVRDNSRAIFNMPNVQGSDSSPTNDLDK